MGEPNCSLQLSMSSWSEGTDFWSKEQVPSKQTPPVCCWNTPTTSWLVQYGFLLFFRTPFSLLYCTSVTGDVQEHIPLKQKKTLNDHCYVLFVFNVMFWLTTNGAEFWFCDSPPSSSVAVLSLALVFPIPVLFCSLQCVCSMNWLPIKSNLIYLIDKPYLS